MTCTTYGNWTRVPNDMLDKILAKGLLKYNEMRIALYIIRQSLGYKTRNGRQKWTRKLTHAQIAGDVSMAPQTVSTTVKNMVDRKILNQDGQKYQLNYNYGEWVLRKTWVVKNLDSQEYLLEKSKKLMENIKNFDDEQPSNASQSSGCETLKETIKETSKETPLMRIVKFWNYLVDREKREQIHRLIEYRRPDDKKLELVLRQKLKVYTEREIKAAIYNYHKFLCLPDEQKTWQGYCWNIYGFLNHENDNISRFKDWDRVRRNWLKETSETQDVPSKWEV